MEEEIQQQTIEVYKTLHAYKTNLLLVGIGRLDRMEFDDRTVAVNIK